VLGVVQEDSTTTMQVEEEEEEPPMLSDSPSPPPSRVENKVRGFKAGSPSTFIGKALSA
jgi:hypothetical protein